MLKYFINETSEIFNKISHSDWAVKSEQNCKCRKLCEPNLQVQRSNLKV